MAAREEAAVYKAENLRLQDELRSCKARLNSALDTQEELLRKNSEKHQQLLDLQQRETKLRDEIASRASLVDYYTSQNQQVRPICGRLEWAGGWQGPSGRGGGFPGHFRRRAGPLTARSGVPRFAPV